MEVEACEDFLHIMFNPLHQILFILYNAKYIICSVPVLCKGQSETGKMPHSPPSIPLHEQ